MINGQMLKVTIYSLLVAIIFGSGLFFSSATTASMGGLAQQSSIKKNYLSIPSVALMPYTQETSSYRRFLDIGDSESPILALDNRVSTTDPRKNWFIAPLNLPHSSTLTGISFYGEARSDDGKIEVAIWQCKHSGGCEYLFDQITNTNVTKKIDSGRIPLDVQVNNEIYSYVLGVNVSTSRSDLRSILLELHEINETSSPSVILSKPWTLARRENTYLLQGDIRHKILICADRQSERMPFVRVDTSSSNLIIPLGGCREVEGSNVRIFATEYGSAYGTFHIQN